MPPVLTYPLRTFSWSLISVVSTIVLYYLNCKQWYQKSKSGFVDFLALLNKELCIWETHLEDYYSKRLLGICWPWSSWCSMLLFLLCLIKSNIWVVKCCVPGVSDKHLAILWWPQCLSLPFEILLPSCKIL